MNWRKATYSGDNGGNCVEVASASGRGRRDDVQPAAWLNGPVSGGAWPPSIRASSAAAPGARLPRVPCHRR